jgi:exodeoxyribonuclease VII small subunit
MVEAMDERQPESFEAALERLAQLVTALESGSLGLTDSIAAYERGVGILKRLHEELAVAEERVKVLVRIDEQGRPVLEDVAEPGTVGESIAAAESAQSAAARPAGRSARAKASRPRHLPGMDDAERA